MLHVQRLAKWGQPKSSDVAIVNSPRLSSCKHRRDGSHHKQCLQHRLASSFRNSFGNAALTASRALASLTSLSHHSFSFLTRSGSFTSAILCPVPVITSVPHLDRFKNQSPLAPWLNSG